MQHCEVCGSNELDFIGAKQGVVAKRPFHLYRCRSCSFAFVSDPWLDFEAIYGEDYYTGKGADPMLDYLTELEHPDATIRQYEWRGILEAVSSLVPLTSTTRWLDFGSGNGGLVRFVRQNSPAQAFGYENGWISDRAISAGIPMLSEQELDANAGSFDVVTAIEVLEHVHKPAHEVKRMRSLMRCGGLLFLTTGNAQPHRGRLLDWDYFIPEIHISLYEPETLERLLALHGFKPERRGFLQGYTDIIRFKALKNIGVRRPATWEKLLPWRVLSRCADSRKKVTAHPLAWAK